MRRLTYNAAAMMVVIGILGSVSFAQTGGKNLNTTPGISGSVHDFGNTALNYGGSPSDASWSGAQICQPCHTPHAATVVDPTTGALLGGPLWNHTLSTATYTLYQTNGTATPGTTLAPTPVTGAVDQTSKLCLSCHDGTVALDSFAGPSGIGGKGTAGVMGGPMMLGTDLSTNHPIGAAAPWPTNSAVFGVVGGFVDSKYRAIAALANGSITAGPGNTGSGGTTAGQAIMPLSQMADGTLAVGCVSCHEVHNATGNKYLLWVPTWGPGTTVDGRSVSGSVLCENCHIR